MPFTTSGPRASYTTGTTTTTTCLLILTHLLLVLLFLASPVSTAPINDPTSSTLPASAEPTTTSTATITGDNSLVPTITDAPTPTSTSTDSDLPTEPCSMTICVDYINECNMFYGECFLAPQCGGTWPEITPPPCPQRSSAVGVAPVVGLTRAV